MAKPPLTVQNAEITTASVEIKTLTVSGKQVTLAVFRQLLEQPLVREDGTLTGEPWGIVNYHPDKCAGSSVAHWHVVWQDRRELRRSTVSVTPAFGTFRPVEADQFVASCVYDVLSTGATAYFHGEPPLSQWASTERKIEIPTDHGVPAVAQISSAGYEAIRCSDELKSQEKQSAQHTDRDGWFAKQIARAQQKHTAAMAAFAEEVSSFGAGTDELHARYLAVVEGEPSRRERHIAVHESLGQLPQLFIAV
jgi:hypothetical protein